MQKTIHSKDYRMFLRLLREAREEAGLTQEDVAACLQETQSFVSKCERGERRIDVVELRQFCLAFGVKFSDFCRRLDNTLD